MTTQFLAGDLTAAVLAVLTNAGFTVGDGQAPATGAGWTDTPGASTFVPYVAVHAISGGYTGGTIAEPDADAGADYILMCVGASRAQVEAFTDRVRAVMLAASITLPNSRSVALMRLEMLGGAMRDDSSQRDSVKPILWFASDRYRLFTVPS